MLRLLMLFNNKKERDEEIAAKKAAKKAARKAKFAEDNTLKVLLVLLINVCVLLKESSMLWLVLNSHWRCR